ncbi:competence type IV pilus ATPase ComGA [Bacillus kwashiorkori]|uniref:competence type IV pilus ATPase ComGA n=1 Tax=Bacillus kwashiorkori TaxID=1522318 RepID=UPI000A9A5F75|nr:competence type IV pilus ATPase ComGA [Bacillus kwashiorkori]
MKLVTMTTEQRAEFLIKMAVKYRATDIHIVPKSNESIVFFRIHHKLIQKFTLTHEESDKIISHLKFQAAMDIGEKRRPQNGSFSITYENKKIGLRLSTLPSIFSESIVIRILPQQDFLQIERLSLFPQQTRIILSLLKYSHGMIVLTGPTGSGKTTTLYSLLRHSTNFLQRNVITLEDPVEKQSDEILQVQVNEKAGITYSTGLKAILRHDPDIIMVGEIRDAETAKIAVRAALTGHLVLTTMHTKNAKGALYRLQEFGISWADMEQTIVAVTAQRLVELICPYCLEDTCSIYCAKNEEKRAALFELLYGRSLKQAFLELKGVRTKPNFPTLKNLLRKGVALGFIREKEYDRWIHSFETENVEYERSSRLSN